MTVAKTPLEQSEITLSSSPKGDMPVKHTHQDRKSIRQQRHTLSKPPVPTPPLYPYGAETLTVLQAAFRGYRLRHRLQRLPAREAERTIRALHTNAHGFRRIALFLLFVGLFFSLVFGGADVAFQRTVHQGLKNHLAMVRAVGVDGRKCHQ